jgi:hypothetical protein
LAPRIALGLANDALLQVPLGAGLVAALLALVGELEQPVEANRAISVLILVEPGQTFEAILRVAGFAVAEHLLAVQDAILAASEQLCAVLANRADFIGLTHGAVRNRAFLAGLVGLKLK